MERLTKTCMQKRLGIVDTNAEAVFSSHVQEYNENCQSAWPIPFVQTELQRLDDGETTF